MTFNRKRKFRAIYPADAGWPFNAEDEKRQIKSKENESD
jgi:hypothetical protein